MRFRYPFGVAGLVVSVVSAHAADGPAVEHVCTVAPDIVAVTIQAGRVEYGRQVPYRAAKGDRVDRKGHQRWVRREGRFLGSLVGTDERILYTPDRLVGEPLDTAWADRPESYSLTAPGHRPRVRAVFRKSKPTDIARVAEWAFQAPIRHVIYLELSEPLARGKRYTLSFEGGRLAPQSFTHDPRSRRSEAVHVSHLGFRPRDPAKLAFLSCWLGSRGGLRYAEGLTFEV
ncbi:MAG: glycoside hydrolase family 9 protein, partial [Planctomycetota bacterium]